MTKGKNQCCMYMKKNLSGSTKNLKETLFNRIHPSVTIFGKTYHCIALQEINEL